ncbi:hypothetical protein SAMN04488066_10898 [Halorubrum aquaticum]|uniref:Uncharacterized protein n=1 Tax=Halorubrum aquaticum TaxID=387340 RepID=A0A1I3B1U0_9EURY|nr:hypothetical protein [Halorubrum aquaticum]SFH55651.1 hypothetical protein SAMN04488066_10898 [Halorubrum aquaticum]
MPPRLSRGPADADDRGQAHTLEAFVAAILLVAGLTFALQATAVTPLSASTSNQHIENQQRAAATGLLETSATNGDLREAVLDWHPGNATVSPGFDPSTEERDHYARGGPPNAFGDALDRTFLDRRIAFNVYVQYHVDPTTYDETPVKRQRMVYMGTPSDNAVSASRTVAVSNDTALTAEGFEDRSLEAVAADPNETFYAPPVDGGPTYNVLEVYIVTWRM